MIKFQRLLVSLLENIEDVSQAISIRLSFQQIVDNLAVTSETANLEREESYFLFLQLNTQLQELKAIMDKNTEKHNK